jgi:hypothetical protein
MASGYIALDPQPLSAKVFLTRTKGLLQLVCPKQLDDIDSSLRVLLDAIESYFYR